MPKLSFSHPSHFSGNVNGISFTQKDDGVWVSEEVSADVAAYFVGIPGYSVLEPAPAEEVPEPVAEGKRRRGRAAAESET